MDNTIEKLKQHIINCEEQITELYGTGSGKLLFDNTNDINNEINELSEGIKNLKEGIRLNKLAVKSLEENNFDIAKKYLIESQEYEDKYLSIIKNINDQKEFDECFSD